MSRPQQRLSWNEASGSVHDGPRRHLLMRPDVLMGAPVRLDGEGQRAWLEAIADRRGSTAWRAGARPPVR
jgi:hypothetical protein